MILMANGHQVVRDGLRALLENEQDIEVSQSGSARAIEFTANARINARIDMECPVSVA